MTETCRNGHPRTPESTLIRRNGVRECRICKNASGRRDYARAKTRPRTPRATPAPVPVTCHAGRHPMTADNTVDDPLFGPQCLACLEASKPEREKRGARRTSDSMPVRYVAPADAEPWAVDAVRRILTTHDALDLADMLGVTA